MRWFRQATDTVHNCEYISPGGSSRLHRVLEAFLFLMSNYELCTCTSPSNSERRSNVDKPYHITSSQDSFAFSAVLGGAYLYCYFYCLAAPGAA